MKLKCSNDECDSTLFRATAIEHLHIYVSEEGQWEDTIESYETSTNTDDAECAECGNEAFWRAEVVKEKKKPMAKLLMKDLV